MAHSIELLPAAAKQLTKIAKGDPARAKHISAAIDALAQTPRTSDNLMRVRVGNYRIIYQINAEKLVILIVKIGHRQSVYNS